MSSLIMNTWLGYAPLWARTVNAALVLDVSMWLVTFLDDGISPASISRFPPDRNGLNICIALNVLGLYDL